jgi:uncharacterized membrane protein YfcA
VYETVVALVAVVAGMVASVVGFGIGSLLTPTLAVGMGMKLAVAAVSVPHLVATLYRYWLVRGEVDPYVFRGFGVSSAVGSLVGAYVGLFAQADWLALLLAALLLFVGVGGLTGWTERMRFRGDSRYLAGLLSGMFGGLVGNQGGVRSAALLGFDLSKSAFVATATASGVIVDLVRMPVYGVAYGRELLGHWPVVLVAVAGCLAGTLLGRSVLARVPQAAFRRVVCWVLVATAVFVVVRYAFA